MIRTDQYLLLLLSSLISANCFGVTNDGAPDRNYQVIVERNPFGLKPPPPPPTNAPPQKADKDEILLTGITSIGSLRAYFQTKAPQAKAPDYFYLGVAEAKNGMEVLDIDPVAKSVRVRNGGVESVMTFAANGVKPPAAPAAAPPGAPGMQPGGPAALPGAGGVPGAGAIAPPPTTASTVGGGAAGAPGTTGTGRIRTIPSRTVRTPTPGMGGGGIDAAAPPPRPDPNAPVQDALMMELQRRANPNIVFPPTPVPGGPAGR